MRVAARPDALVVRSATDGRQIARHAARQRDAAAATPRPISASTAPTCTRCCWRRCAAAARSRSTPARASPQVVARGDTVCVVEHRDTGLGGRRADRRRRPLEHGALPAWWRIRRRRAPPATPPGARWSSSRRCRRRCAARRSASGSGRGCMRWPTRCAAARRSMSWCWPKRRRPAMRATGTRPPACPRCRRPPAAPAPALQALLEAVPSWRAWTLSDRPPLTGPAADGRRAHRTGGRCGASDAALPGAGRGHGDRGRAWRWPTRSTAASSAAVPAALARYAEARWAAQRPGAGAGAAQRRDLPCHRPGARGPRCGAAAARRPAARRALALRR